MEAEGRGMGECVCECESVWVSRESKKGRGRVLCQCACVCVCARSQEQNRAWGFSKQAEKQFSEANAKQHTLSADWIFSSTLIKNHIDERKGWDREGAGERNRRARRREGGWEQREWTAPWNLNKTCLHRKQGPQNSNRKLAPDSEYCQRQSLAKQGCAAQRYESWFTERRERTRKGRVGGGGGGRRRGKEKTRI